MLLTDEDPSCADWWCGFGQGIAGESLAEPFGRLTTATPFGVVPLLGGVPYFPDENLASFRTSGGGDPRRILLGGTALEKTLRARIGITGESLAEPFGRLTTATLFGVVPLLRGVVLDYPSPFLTIFSG
uniref:Uncharacterized protein n=1 Tax=Oryza barthii TaxID=65489 RepID=A0A0D3HP73_9ORYZ